MRNPRSRLDELERQLRAGGPECSAIEERKRGDFPTAVFALWLHVKRPADHPDLTRYVAALLEPDWPPVSVGVRETLDSGVPFLEGIADPGLRAQFANLARSACELPPGLARLFDKLAESAARDGNAWDPTQASLAELLAVALSRRTNLETET
jgi:hypothetical protein